MGNMNSYSSLSHIGQQKEVDLEKHIQSYLIWDLFDLNTSILSFVQLPKTHLYTQIWGRPKSSRILIILPEIHI